MEAAASYSPVPRPIKSKESRQPPPLTLEIYQKYNIFFFSYDVNVQKKKTSGALGKTETALLPPAGPLYTVPLRQETILTHTFLQTKLLLEVKKL